MSLFSDNLARLRIQRGRSYTQQRVADAIGVLRSTYSGWEIGTAEPSMSNLVKLSHYYGISLDRLTQQNLSRMSDWAFEVALRVDRERITKKIY
ncbi:MAG TPA: helix-turn-helix transcriptional regulator [Flavobacteriales bacterium]|nr:helix-turn-helix transcriptional regulator [Flavobacteriales bacterium]